MSYFHYLKSILNDSFKEYIKQVIFLNVLFLLIGIHSMQGWTATMTKEPTVKRSLLILDLKPLRKAFYRQRIPEFSRVRKETVYIDILATSRNGDRKIMQSIRITSRPPSRKRKWNQLSQLWRTSNKVITIEKT